MLQLADHSYVQPEGKIEDILVKVDKFIFPVDFLILECEADEYAPIILGRPFLSTSRAVIDFDNDEIIFKVENNSVKMKSLTKKMDKGKSIADTPATEVPTAKLYMGDHVERDRAAIKWEEQAFFFDDALPNYGLEQFVHNRLRELGWFQFGRQPPRANFNWVLEFYANNANGEDFSVVRGRRVPATATIINDLFDLPNDAPSFYQMLEGFEEEDYEVIKNLLCQPNTQWNTTGRNPYSVSRQSLILEAKLWNTFVKRNLLPTSHNHTVDRTRLLLINTIMTGFRVNVGEILANELAALCQSDKGILTFPCLVSALCRRVNTPMFDTDNYQAEKTGWTRAVYMRKMNVADAEPLNMAMPTPPASPVNEADVRVEDSAPPSPAEPSAADE
ncbi:hypothetical protein V6N11_071512 [Hibiscus sabdariffa]|uniref:Putative plant transposon protein domain-containing protein n=1 Tax=Hibiscus sabdariffa TaxID=183260 RepID=A0ABR2U0U7_9ROSI